MEEAVYSDSLSGQLIVLLTPIYKYICTKYNIKIWPSFISIMSHSEAFDHIYTISVYSRYLAAHLKGLQWLLKTRKMQKADSTTSVCFVCSGRETWRCNMVDCILLLLLLFTASVTQFSHLDQDSS